jgi:DNA invertase Pin-like site-specific DNA recombinase
VPPREEKMGLTKLTPALARRLLHQLGQHQSRGAAARACGISPTTLAGWLRQGNAGRHPHAELRRAIRAIEVERRRSFKLTPRLRQQLLRLLATGCSRQAAARAAGVGICTLWRWFKSGQAGAWPRHSRLHALSPARR